MTKRKLVLVRATITSMVALILGVVLVLPNWAANESKKQAISVVGVDSEVAFPSSPAEKSPRGNASKYALVPKSKRELRVKPERGQIFQLDEAELGARKPLVLVHGGGGEKKQYFHWGKVIDGFTARKDFGEKFKLYLYRYDTSARLAKAVPEFQEALLGLHEVSCGRPISILALSMGGNLTQQALLDEKVDGAVDVVLAMGTPFHGSPLFSPDWFEYSLDKNKILPWSRNLHYLDYLLFFSRHKNYQQDLKWDDLDGLIPNIGQFQKRNPLAPRGDLTPERDANPVLAAVNTNGKLKKDKFITYAGYLVNPYLLTGARKKLTTTILAPYRFLTVRLPVQLGREHPALKMLNEEMGRLAVNPDASLYGPPNPHTFVLNDGITPLVSALFLPDSALKAHPCVQESDFLDLKKLTDVQTARIFRDIDHITFLDGRPPHRGSPLLSDQLHPLHGRRMIVDWMLYDLMQAEKEGQEIVGDAGAN